MMCDIKLIRVFLSCYKRILLSHQSTSFLLKLPCHQETNYSAQRISDYIVRLGKPQTGGKLGGLDKQCQGKGKPEDFPLRTEAVKSCSQWNKQPDIVDDLCVNCVFQCKLFQIREGYQRRSLVAGLPEHECLIKNKNHIGRQQQGTGFRRKQRHADAQQHTDHHDHIGKPSISIHSLLDVLSSL